MYVMLHWRNAPSFTQDRALKTQLPESERLRSAQSLRRRRVLQQVPVLFTGGEFLQLRYVAARDERRPELARRPLSRAGVARLVNRAVKLHLARHGVEVLQ